MPVFLMSDSEKPPELLDVLENNLVQRVFHDIPDVCLVFCTGEAVNLYINLTYGGIMKTANLSDKQRSIMWNIKDLPKADKLVVEVSIKQQRRSAITPKEVNGSVEKVPRHRLSKKSKEENNTIASTSTPDLKSVETTPTPDQSEASGAEEEFTKLKFVKDDDGERLKEVKPKIKETPTKQTKLEKDQTPKKRGRPRKITQEAAFSKEVGKSYNSSTMSQKKDKANEKDLSDTEVLVANQDSLVGEEEVKEKLKRMKKSSKVSGQKKQVKASPGNRNDSTNRKRKSTNNSEKPSPKKLCSSSITTEEGKDEKHLENDSASMGDSTIVHAKDDNSQVLFQVCHQNAHPTARWGSTLTCAEDGQAYLIGGQCGDKFSADSCWLLDTELNWRQVETQFDGASPELRVGHTATYDQTLRCIYVYGGSKRKKWYSDVHVLDIDSKAWKLSKVEGHSPVLAYHTSCLFRHELWVFGGISPRPDPEPDMCSNEVHIYSPSGENWYMPIVTGEKPSARSGHSATMLGDQMVVFGGWDMPQCFNDVFVLDLSFVEWTKPKIGGKPPTAKSWHVSCALSDRRILIHGGYNGELALGDLFILDLSRNSWHQLTAPSALSARAGHVGISVATSAAEDEQERERILVFGGGDNEKTWFDDLSLLSLPLEGVLDTDVAHVSDDY